MPIPKYSIVYRVPCSEVALLWHSFPDESSGLVYDDLDQANHAAKSALELIAQNHPGSEAKISLFVEKGGRKHWMLAVEDNISKALARTEVVEVKDGGEGHQGSRTPDGREVESWSEPTLRTPIHVGDGPRRTKTVGDQPEAETMPCLAAEENH
mgnify:CR=1 FL=1|tara:strand:- start:12519 stop:12980 length:462 start_codon:yes stop_codon:yes gene_type:complete